MKDFKFFQKIREPQSFLSFIKLKDRFNRDKYLQVKWEERTAEHDNSNVLTFQGNILEFYNMMGPFRVHRTAFTPTIYEIYKKQQGYFDRSLIYRDPILRNSFFISRSAKLTILYKI